MTRKRAIVKVTVNFEANLGVLLAFLNEADARGTFDALLDRLLDTVIPNLERFPQMGQPFLSYPVLSVEAGEKIRKLKVRVGDGDLREYLTGEYVILYAVIDQTVYLLSIKHQRQLSFDFERLWGGSPPLKE